MNKDEFRQWRLRMGGLTIDQTGIALGIARGTVRAYSDGHRDIPDRIVKLCELLEKQKIEGDLKMAKTGAENKQQSSGGVVSEMLTVAYLQAMARRNPVTAITVNRQSISDCMGEAVAALAGMGVTFNAPENNETAG